jgi:hypothetical protein
MRAAKSAPYTDLYYVATTEYSDYIYMLDAYPTTFASTQKYNAQTDVWTSARRIPTLRATQSNEGAATGVTVGNRIYVLGGATPPTNSAKNEVYFPGSDSWSTRTSLPLGVSGHAAGLVGSIIVVAGGYPIRQNTQLYNTATDVWTSGKAARPIGRHELADTVSLVSHASAFRACFQAPTCLLYSRTLRVRSKGTLCTSLAASIRPAPPRILCTYTTFFQGPGRQVTLSARPTGALDLAGFSPAQRARRPAPSTVCCPHRCAHADGAQEWLLGVGRQEPVLRWHDLCARTKS